MSEIKSRGLAPPYPSFATDFIDSLMASTLFLFNVRN